MKLILIIISALWLASANNLDEYQVDLEETDRRILTEDAESDKAMHLNSAFELETIPRTKSFDRSMFKGKKGIKPLKKIKCGKKFNGNKFAKSTYEDPILWKSRKLHKGGYLKGQYRPKENCRFAIEVPEDTPMTILFDYMDIQSENQKTCRGDDYLSIKTGGKRRYFCGNSPTDDSYLALSISPTKRASKVHFTFRTNNDGDSGRGVQLLFFADELPMDESEEDSKEESEEESENCTPEKCNNNGSCDPDGSCVCNENFSAPDCSTCVENYFGNNCETYCDDTECPDNMICNPEGNCICNDGFSGPDCFIATGELILVLTGYNRASRAGSNLTRVVNMTSNTECDIIPQYPVEDVVGAAGVIFNGSPLVCGGDPIGECYYYNKSSDSWTYLKSLDDGVRSFYAMSVVDGTIWLTGGENSASATTESIGVNSLSPSLPISKGRNWHCQISLPDGKVMLLGTSYCGNCAASDSTTIFNPVDESFTDGPSMNYGREAFGCTLFMSPLHDNRYVILAAGNGNSAEILDFTDPDASWEEIEPLPNSVNFCQAVPSMSGTGAYLTTGSIFYELSSNGSSWTWTLKGSFSDFPLSPVVLTLPPGYTC